MTAGGSRAVPAGPPVCYICGEAHYSRLASGALYANWRVRRIKGELKWQCYLCSVLAD